jgi:hypothetical protein
VTVENGEVALLEIGLVLGAGLERPQELESILLLEGILLRGVGHAGMTLDGFGAPRR